MTSRFSKALLVGTLSTLGAIAWSGCGPGSESRYSCDAEGCYTCDAYGCSAVSAPAHPPCTGNASCAPGSVCTATGCTTACSTDATCPRGETCQSGLCSPPGTLPGAEKECTTKGDCGEGKSCNAGKCEACGGEAGPCPCAEAGDCAGGLTCVAGACTAPENTCKYSSECGDDKVCADGRCLTSCEAGPCEAGFTCDKGVCKPSSETETPACTADAQCTNPDAPKCVSGACVKSCAADAECGADKYCDQGACVVDTRPKPNCTADDQCGGSASTPKKCLGGFCKYACTSDQYCRTIDSRIGFCAEDGVCRTAAEANAKCFSRSDCGPGQQCIDNACK